MVFCGIYPIDGDDFAEPTGGSGEAPPERRLGDLRTGDLGCPRVRVPLRVPRSAPHGDRPGAPRAGVRPVAHRHRPERRVPGPSDRRLGGRGPQPFRDARAPEARLDRGALPPGDHPDARPSTPGTLMDLCQSRRGEMIRMEYLSPGAHRAGVPHSARRGGDGFLRRPQEPDQGLREPRLRAGRMGPRGPGQDRRPAQRRAGRRVQRHRAPLRGAGVRAQDDRAAARA